MLKYSFTNDYSEGAHPKIIKALEKTNLEQQSGYSEDSYTKEAVKLIKKRMNSENSDVHIVSGGTQGNLIVISSVLRPHEAVISAATGHINVHEAGAIESTGHKVCTVKTKDGKLTPEQIQKVLDIHEDEHMVKPKLVYISNSTEIGTVYNKKELDTLHDFCKAKNLYLYMDGARLGSALQSPKSDLKIEDLPRHTDIFYIGGTKNGALLGEAIVINNPSLQEDFRFHIKQKGALLAKGRVLGIQFMELFKDDLFFEIGKYSNDMAFKISSSLKDFGYEFLGEPSSNQIFPILPNTLISSLLEKYDFYKWTKIDEENSAVRLVTSWATNESIADEFIKDIKELGDKNEKNG
ncbi:MAG TPA: aminotransferase class I/II-fold pyridoxal phosphate-dependent enzyme [Clostridia bacterium]|nr:aminotransferase class I/II-fold pyridoxal phosphate-dependent enzyme [Clostridia bacterium]